jgi:hypothetical protein
MRVDRRTGRIDHCGWRRVVRAIAAALVLLGLQPAAQAQMKFVETANLRLVYFDPAETYLVPYATQCFLNSLVAQKARFGYVPDGKAAVLLQDFSDRGNATTILGAPRSRVFVDIAPANLAFETFSPGERLITEANHELVHLATSDRPSPADERFRRLFGGKVGPVAEHPESILYYYLTNPRATAPRWYQEGSAVFMETWMGGGLGRAQGGYDEMVFRAMVNDGADFYDPLGLVAKGTEVDFQVGANAYLYGTRFMSYLALKYTPERLLAWWRRDSGTVRYYADDFQRVFGISLERAWQDWVDWEHGFQQQNLAAVREHPITQYHDLARQGLGAISRGYVSADGSKFYAAVRYPGRLPSIVAISLTDGSVAELQEVKGAISYRVSSLAYDPASETLFYTTDNLTYRNVMALDLRSGKTRMLLKGARIGDLAFNRADRSLWGLRTNNGFVVLVRIPFPYRQWQQVHVFPYGEVAFDLDVSPDGEQVSTSVAGPGPDPSSPQVMQVRVMTTDSLLNGDATPLRKFEFGSAVPEGFVFSRDGRYLYGSSYYTGVSNIYRYEVATGKLEPMSNAALGFFRPLPLDDENLLVFHYTAQGFVPATIPAQTIEDLSAITFLGEQIATRHPVVQGWAVGSPAGVPYEAQIQKQGVYRPARELSLEAIYPIVEGYKDVVALGAHARFSDPIGFDSLSMTLSYSPDGSLPGRERAHVSARLQHEMWSAGVQWNGADFYDLFGPTKRSREGYSGFVGYDRPLIFDPPRTMNFTGKVAYYGDLDSLPGFQNVPSPSDRLFTADVGLVSKNARASIGRVDDEKGVNWSLNAHVYGAAGDVIPALYGQWDVGFQLPLHHSSLWWRNGAGFSSGNRDNPLVNAYFGGFGNNYVDNAEAKRYRDLFRMPGFEIDALQGKTFAKSMLEWSLPPLRFGNLGSPGFYASWLRSAVFATALVTDPDSSDFRQDAYDVGLQLDLQLQVMHRLPMMLSFGYAKGFAGNGLGEDEFMVSLKVL